MTEKILVQPSLEEILAHGRVYLEDELFSVKAITNLEYRDQILEMLDGANEK